MSGKIINVVIIVDDKEKMLAVLQQKSDEATEYRDRCVDVLVEQWGAVRDKIDLIGLKESVYGHQIHCLMKGLEVGEPSEYIKERLTHLSMVGLGRCGLTYKQYKRVLNEK